MGQRQAERQIETGDRKDRQDRNDIDRHADRQNIKKHKKQTNRRKDRVRHASTNGSRFVESVHRGVSIAKQLEMSERQESKS